MIRVIRRQETDHTPCAMMSFAALRGRCQGPYQVTLKELSMGLDSFLFVPSATRGERPDHPDLRGLPVRWPASIEVELWEESLPSEQGPVLHKVYHTPAGHLRTAVRKTVDWPYGSAVPLMGDYQVPRAIKPLITGRADLDALRCLLLSPDEDAVAAFEAEMRRARAFRDAHGVMLAGGWGVGADMVGWLCGLEPMALMMMDDPDLLGDLLAIIAEWNLARMRLVLEGGVDLYIRRSWYESVDFWSPRLYRRFILPILQREAALAHHYDTPLGIIMTTGTLPLLDDILASGADVLIGVDPLQGGGAPLPAIRDRLGGRLALWGGVNGAITVEEGSEEEVRQAVIKALDTMRGVPGFILSPVDNITAITARAWRNVDVLIETWRKWEGF
jgi:uroporphyrinogen-III decarboxylase